MALQNLQLESFTPLDIKATQSYVFAGWPQLSPRPSPDPGSLPNIRQIKHSADIWRDRAVAAEKRLEAIVERCRMTRRNNSDQQVLTETWHILTAAGVEVR